MAKELKSASKRGRICQCRNCSGKNIFLSYTQCQLHERDAGSSAKSVPGSHADAKNDPLREDDDFEEKKGDIDDPNANDREVPLVNQAGAAIGPDAGPALPQRVDLNDDAAVERVVLDFVLNQLDKHSRHFETQAGFENPFKVLDGPFSKHLPE